MFLRKIILLKRLIKDWTSYPCLIPRNTQITALMPMWILQNHQYFLILKIFAIFQLPLVWWQYLYHLINLPSLPSWKECDVIIYCTLQILSSERRGRFRRCMTMYVTFFWSTLRLTKRKFFMVLNKLSWTWPG